MKGLRHRLPVLLLIFALALVVRELTGNFMRAHINDPGWFQYGSYALVDRGAQDIIDGRSPFFWIDDPSRTDRIVYPPGFQWWVAAIYEITRESSPLAVQRIQIVLDAFSVLLLVGIGVTAFGWGVGYAAGFFGALSPLLAFSGAYPSADAPASWIILGAAWCLLLANERASIYYAVAAGGLLGMACWFRVNPLFLVMVWPAVIVIVARDSWRHRLKLSAAIAASTLIVLSPLIIRNLTVFYPEVAPTGLGIGWNLLAGIGETDLGKDLGVPCCDAEMVAQDRKTMDLPDDAELALNYPDGIKRDRERGRRALGIIASHPAWYAGTMARRVWGHLKYFGSPVPNVGTMGFNVTPDKTLSPEWRGGVVSAVVSAIGMAQSVWRFAALPLIIMGLVVGYKRNWFAFILLGTTAGYYLLTLAVGHSEIRYGLPMQAILIVFAGVALLRIAYAMGFGQRV